MTTIIPNATGAQWTLMAPYDFVTFKLAMSFVDISTEMVPGTSVTLKVKQLGLAQGNQMLKKERGLVSRV